MTAGRPEGSGADFARAPTPATVYLQRVPKVELHVHLEGAVRPQRLLAILHRHGQHSDWRTPADLDWLYRHASYAEFLDHFRFVVTCLRDVQDVHDIAKDLFAEMAAQHIVYAEVLFSAGIFARQGMSWEALLSAVSAAEASVLAPLRRGQDLPRYNLVIDLVRNFGPEFADAQVQAIARLQHPRVVGVHLGGDEANFPARWFAGAFAQAGAAGLGLAAHAGEGAGAASVREAVRALQATRIGHGIRCLEDPELVRELVARGTTLEVCPHSNVATRLVPELRAHPLPALLQHGLRVTLGADDPSFFATDLTAEFLAAHTILGLDLGAIDAMVDAGMQAAFLPAAARAAGLALLRQERAKLRRALRFPA